MPPKTIQKLNLIIGAGDLRKLIKYQIGPLPESDDKRELLEALLEPIVKSVKVNTKTIVDFFIGLSADNNEMIFLKN